MHDDNIGHLSTCVTKLMIRTRRLPSLIRVFNLRIEKNIRSLHVVAVKAHSEYSG